MKYNAVIFDMDGLMFDTEGLLCRMWKKAGLEKGYTIPDNIFFETIGSNVIETEKIFKRKFGNDFPYQDLREIRLHYTDRFLEQEGVPIKKGLTRLLLVLKEKGIKKAVATSTERQRALKLITLAGLEEEFDCVVGGDDVSKSKPEPDIFLETAKRMRIDPSECIVLEDSEKGIKGALAAGMHPVMVPDLIPISEEIRSKGIFICQTLDEVVEFILTM